MLLLIIVGVALLFGLWGWSRLAAPPPPDPGPFLTIEDLAHKRDVV